MTLLTEFQRNLKMINIINRQRKCQLSANRWRELAAEALKALKRESPDVSIIFVSDAAIKKLNRQFRGRNYATDVLSFPTEAEAFETENHSSLGEIVISAERATAQAKQNGLTFNNEVQQLVLHGLLHLCGYDHETDSGEMNRLEVKLRRKLKI